MLVFTSGLIYLLIFAICLFFASLADNFMHTKEHQRNTFLPKVFLFIAILIPTILAGIRGNSVGTDTTGYPLYWFTTLKGVNFQDVFYLEFEVLYLILAFVSSMLSTDMWILLFLTQILTIGPIVVAASRIKKFNHTSIAIVLFFYLFIFFNNSLNIMRASIAGAFLILSYTYLRERRYITFILLSGVAWGFHYLSIVGAVTLIIVHFLTRKPGKSLLSFIIIILFIPIAIGSLAIVGEWMVSIGILSSKYLNYVKIFIYGIGQDYWFHSSLLSKGLIFDISSRFIFVVMATSPVLKLSLKGMVVDKDSLFLAYVVLIGFVIYASIFFLLRTEYGGRLSMFMDMFLILALPYFGEKAQLSKSNGITIARFYAIAFTIGYWVIWIMIGGWSNSNTYTIRF